MVILSIINDGYTIYPVDEGNEDVGLIWDNILLFCPLLWIKFIALPENMGKLSEIMELGPDRNLSRVILDGCFSTRKYLVTPDTSRSGWGWIESVILTFCVTYWVWTSPLNYIAGKTCQVDKLQVDQSDLRWKQITSKHDSWP